LTELIARNGLALHARDVGGMTSRTLRLDLANGNVTVKCPGVNTYLL